MEPRLIINSINLPMPRDGYRTLIKFPFRMKKLSNGLHSVFDYGIQYDQVFSEFTLRLTKSECYNLISMHESNKGKEISLELPNNSGFFPFGNIYTDSQTFLIVIDNIRQSGLLSSPFKHYQVTISCKLTSTPANRLQPENRCKQGNLSFYKTIGPETRTVDYIRMPSNWYNPKVNYNYTVMDTIENYTQTATSESRISAFTFDQLNDYNTFKMIDFFKNFARNNSFTLDAPIDHVLFGVSSGDDKTFQGKFISENLNIFHQSYDSFTINFEVEKE